MRIIVTILILLLILLIVRVNVFSKSIHDFFETDRVFYISNTKVYLTVLTIDFINIKHFFLLLFKGNWKAALGVVFIGTLGIKVIALTLIGNIRTHFDLEKDVDESKIPDSEKSKYINKMKQLDINETVNDILSESINHYDKMVTNIAQSVLH